VGVCGEAAADPALIPRLIELGIKELNMSAPSIPRAKKVVSDLYTSGLSERCEGEAAARQNLSRRAPSGVVGSGQKRDPVVRLALGYLAELVVNVGDSALHVGREDDGLHVEG
jgi:hypothetical protein